MYRMLGSLGIYYLSIFRSHESVLNDLERTRSNFFWGGNQDGKKMAWVKWSIILNSYDHGGLNIGSLKAFNLALLQKWRWRLFTSPNDLWVKVVKAFHGHEGGFDNNGCSFKVVSLAGQKGNWYSGEQLERENAINYYDL
ncbi:hypothetical protein Tco_1166285 [Tanacetum coccineum]